MYNQKLSQYVKDYRNYGTPQKLRSDQIHLICHIGRNPKCNLRYLAEATGACFPTVSLQVDRLRNIGLVTKTCSSANQREIEIALTEDGRALLITVDGRWWTSSGMTAQELTRMLVRHFNPRCALNLDGGGSTTMLIGNRGVHDTHVVNFPVDNKRYDHYGQRAVNNVVLVKRND